MVWTYHFPAFVLAYIPAISSFFLVPNAWYCTEVSYFYQYFNYFYRFHLYCFIFRFHFHYITRILVLIRIYDVPISNRCSCKTQTLHITSAKRRNLKSNSKPKGKSILTLLTAHRNYARYRILPIYALLCLPLPPRCPDHWKNTSHSAQTPLARFIRYIPSWFALACKQYLQATLMTISSKSFE